jgi:hypothetical protein
MPPRANQDSLDLGWSDVPLSDASQGQEQSEVDAAEGTQGAPLDSSDDDEPTRVATAATFLIAPPPTAEVVASAPSVEVTATAPTVEVIATAPTVEVIATTPTAEVTATAPTVEVIATAPTVEVIATAPTGEVAATLDAPVQTEQLPPEVTVEASSVSEVPAALPPSSESPVTAGVSEVVAVPLLLDEPPLTDSASDALAAPPPLTEPAVAEAAPAAVEPTALGARQTPRTVPPITNPPPAELARPPWAVEPAVAPQSAIPAVAATPSIAPAAPVEATPPSVAPAAPVEATPPSVPPASIAPPPIVPATFTPFTPASLAPMASDWNEFGSPSFLETMKRTRPTSAWTGVALFVAALTFVGGIGVGGSFSASPPPPIAVPLPPPVNAPAASPLSTLPTSPSTAATAAPANPGTVAPAAPTKPLPPFDTKAARAALDAAAAKTKTCRAVNEPKGAIATTVTFAPSGRVSDVAINTTRYAGTKTGKCISQRLSEAQAPEFSGFPASLKKTIAVR